MATPKVPTIISRADLLNADDRAEKLVEVPEWGGSVKIKALSLGQWQDAVASATVNGVVDDNLAALNTLVAGIVDPQLEAADVAVLRTKGTAAITRLMGEIAALSGVDAAAVKQAEATFPAAA